MNCPACSTAIPHHAKYCPKCGAAAPVRAAPDGAPYGKAAGPHEPPLAHAAIPARTSLPRAGRVFFSLLLLGVLALGIGIWRQIPVMIFAGAGLMGILVLILLIGDFLGL